MIAIYNINNVYNNLLYLQKRFSECPQILNDVNVNNTVNEFTHHLCRLSWKSVNTMWDSEVSRSRGISYELLEVQKGLMLNTIQKLSNEDSYIDSIQTLKLWKITF